jgi:hypothetical protein
MFYCIQDKHANHYNEVMYEKIKNENSVILKQ